jgi:hypothetical protein
MRSVEAHGFHILDNMFFQKIYDTIKDKPPAFA